MQTLILDNGSCTIKGGYADYEQPLVVPNMVTRTKRTRRVYVGDLAYSTSDLSGLYYRSPFERGYLVRWDAELVIWDRVLSNDVLGCEPQQTNLILSEPVFNFQAIQRQMDEIVFEEYGFASLIRAPAPRLAAQHHSCCVIVDVGHAFTYVVPYRDQQQIPWAIRRVDVGGLMLTSYLKETVSFRYWDMMDETYIMSQVKERTCFVSQDFYSDLERAKRTDSMKLEYVLPDFTASKTGYVRGTQADAEGMQVLPLNNERFAVPEALFHPEDVGVDQGGIHRAIVQAVNACPEEARGVLLASIVLIGGSAKLPGLRERLQAEVQAMSSSRVCVSVPDDPEAWAWQGGRLLAQGHGERRISRQQYLEMGASRVAAHFETFA
ncbi:actin-like protein ARP6 [Coemansia spiralis]|nr:actin-like protein ARP6 [Coemansia spiralis]